MLPLRSVFLCFLALSLTNASAFSSRFAVVSKGSRHHHVAAAAAAQRRRSPAVWKILRGGAQEEEEEESRSTSTSSTIDETPPSATTTTSTTAATVLVLPKQLTKITTACASIGKLYLQQLQQNPIVTKSITAGFIFGLSDVLAQKIDQAPEKEEKQKFNWTRLTASILVGLLYFGPAAHYWYDMIFKLLPGTGLLSTIYKAFWGQAIFGPAFTCIFFATSLLQAGTFSLSNWAEKIRNDLPGAWLAGAGFWPLVDLISYSIIPIVWIPLFVNMCSLVWTVYLSIVANKQSKSST